MIFQHRQLTILLMLCTQLIASGCAVFRTDDGRKYETVSAGPQRDTPAARKLNGKAIRALEDGELENARTYADKALVADVDFAPAHNSLGRVHFCRKDYYLAAWEFEFALRLQPNVPEYHNNLGLVFEAAGRLPEAIAEFQVATDLDPDSFHYVSNLTRARIRWEERSPETRALLERVVLVDPRPEWKDWAQTLIRTTHRDIPAADISSLRLQEAVPAPSEVHSGTAVSTENEGEIGKQFDSILDFSPRSDVPEAEAGVRADDWLPLQNGHAKPAPGSDN